MHNWRRYNRERASQSLPNISQQLEKTEVVALEQGLAISQAARTMRSPAVAAAEMLASCQAVARYTTIVAEEALPALARTAEA